VVADIIESAAKSVAEAIADQGGTADYVVLDISDESSVKDVVDFTVKRFGGVDLLHNVAADLTHATANDHDILSTTMEAYDQTLAVTLRGYVLTCRAVIPHMLERGGGAIVNTSSGAAHRALPHGVRYSYAIAKSGLGPLSQHIAVKFGKQNIRCNTAAMGMIATENFFKTLSPERVQQIRESALVPDPGNPEGLAGAIVFLLSDDARYITGQTINVDGGNTAI
jgi:NAD(P)-dependent dehydrogenase (short-subunit alcohol dehydrogenase family)